MTRLLALLLLVLALPALADTPPRKPDVPYVPTPQNVVDAMLRIAGVTDQDVVYDLGCGDGRLVIGAARLGALGVGVDLDPLRVEESRRQARLAGVTSRTRFVQGDLFHTDLSEATVVTLYLLTTLNVKLRPKLKKELKPGSRVVSYTFGMGDWKPERTVTIDGRPIHLWRI